MNDKKVLGIIGGVGPLATMLLGEMIVTKTKAEKDQDHVYTLISNHPAIPDRTSYILDNSKPNPVPVIIDDAHKLRSIGAEVLAIPCNTAHSFYEEIQTGAGIPVLHMIAETAKVVAEQGAKRVGILATTGTLTTAVYQTELEKVGVEPIVPNGETQKLVMSVIYDDVKAGKQVELKKWKQIEHVLLDECDAIILGCTELSVVKRQLQLQKPYVDSLEVLAERAIISCGYDVKKSTTTSEKGDNHVIY